MSKIDELKKLDDLVRAKMIECLENDSTESLNELTPVISYLKSNQMVEEKKIDDDATTVRKKKLEEAKARRNESNK